MCDVWCVICVICWATTLHLLGNCTHDIAAALHPGSKHVVVALLYRQRRVCDYRRLLCFQPAVPLLEPEHRDEREREGEEGEHRRRHQPGRARVWDQVVQCHDEDDAKYLQSVPRTSKVRQATRRAMRRNDHGAYTLSASTPKSRHHTHITDDTLHTQTDLTTD